MSSIELNATRDLLMHSICINIIQISTPFLLLLLFFFFFTVYVSLELDFDIRNMIYYFLFPTRSASFFLHWALLRNWFILNPSKWGIFFPFTFIVCCLKGHKIFIYQVKVQSKEFIRCKNKKSYAILVINGIMNIFHYLYKSEQESSQSIVRVIF